jgi:hypothetical protein
MYAKLTNAETIGSSTVVDVLSKESIFDSDTNECEILDKKSNYLLDLTRGGYA